VLFTEKRSRVFLFASNFHICCK